MVLRATAGISERGGEPSARVLRESCVNKMGERDSYRIASTLTAETVEAIRCITSAGPMATPEDALGSMTSSELSSIARILPSDAIARILCVADRTSHECFKVITAVASVVAEDVGIPKDVAHNERGYHPSSSVTRIPIRLAASGFPGPQCQ